MPTTGLFCLTMSRSDAHYVVSLIGLSAMIIVVTIVHFHAPYYYVTTPLCALSVVAALASLRLHFSQIGTQLLSKGLLASTVHISLLVAHALPFWWPAPSFDPSVSGPKVACFAGTMQFLFAHLHLPLQCHAVPLALMIVIPLTAYPSEFLTPIPLALSIIALTVTLTSSPWTGQPQNPSNFGPQDRQGRPVLSPVLSSGHMEVPSSDGPSPVSGRHQRYSSVFSSHRFASLWSLFPQRTHRHESCHSGSSFQFSRHNIINSSLDDKSVRGASSDRWSITMEPTTGPRIAHSPPGRLIVPPRDSASQNPLMDPRPSGDDLGRLSSNPSPLLHSAPPIEGTYSVVSSYPDRHSVIGCSNILLAAVPSHVLFETPSEVDSTTMVACSSPSSHGPAQGQALQRSHVHLEGNALDISLLTEDKQPSSLNVNSRSDSFRSASTKSHLVGVENHLIASPAPQVSGQTLRSASVAFRQNSVDESTFQLSTLPPTQSSNTHTTGRASVITLTASRMADFQFPFDKTISAVATGDPDTLQFGVPELHVSGSIIPATSSLDQPAGRNSIDLTFQRRLTSEFAVRFNVLLETCAELKKAKKKADEQAVNLSEQVHELQRKLQISEQQIVELQEERRSVNEEFGVLQNEMMELQSKYRAIIAHEQQENSGLSQPQRIIPAVVTEEDVPTPTGSPCQTTFTQPAVEEKKQSDNQRIGTEDVSLALDAVSTQVNPDISQHSSLVNISHDMRTPITTALTALELILDDNPDMSSQERRELLQQAWAALQSTILLINNVLDFSKLRNASMTPAMKEVNIRRLVADVLRPLEVQANTLQVELILSVKSHVPTTLHCDAILIQRVLTNLVANALKFSISNGRVIVSLDWDESTHRLQGSVRDTGAGMTTDELGGLFQHFYQAAHGKGGTGLGLAICYQLIGEMGGRIWAESAGKGNGSTFKFELPMVPNGAIKSDPRDILSAMILDDDPDRCEATSEMVRYAGLKPLLTHSLPSDDLKPAIVFISITLPLWRDLAVEWRQKYDYGIAICLVVPHRFMMEAHPRNPNVDFVMRSPIHMNELRRILEKLFSCSGSQTSRSDPLSARAVSVVQPASVDAMSETKFLLLAEDNRVNHKLFLMQLKKFGLTNVHSAYDGEEAVALSEKHKYTLIIMDCVMPKMDGYEAAQRIRSSANPNQDTPIVALTANHSNENAERCRGCGMTEFFTKPITPQMWEAIVEMVGISSQSCKSG